LFPLFATSVIDIGGKFSGGPIDTHCKFATGIDDTPKVRFAKFTADVIDTGGGKFITFVNDSGGAP
jgi:hypothetical protein